MQDLMTFEPSLVAPDTHSLTTYVPVPGFGMLAVNAFVIRARQPVLVDTGVAAGRAAFMRDLESVIDPRDLRWIWVTHTDPDHLGNLESVLAAAPGARVVTTYLGMGKLNLLGLPLDRVYLLNPGQRLDVGDRCLRALVPPVFDAPESTALVDDRTGTLFSADCFGALLQEPAANAAAIPADALREGMLMWSTVDAPWLAGSDGLAFTQALDSIRSIDPATVLSSHLPPAVGMTATLLDHLVLARSATPFQGPDQAALERMLGAAVANPARDDQPIALR